MAAGRLAQHFGVLPKQLDCEEVALACYHLYSPVPCKTGSIVEKLVEIARDPKTHTLDTRSLRIVTERQLEEHGVFLNPNRRGETELLYWPSAFRKRFPDYARIFRLPEVAALMKVDKDRPTVKRVIRKGKEDRVYCFVLPC